MKTAISFVLGLVIGVQLGCNIINGAYVPYGFHGPRTQAEADKLNAIHATAFMVFRPAWIKNETPKKGSTEQAPGFEWFDIEVPVRTN